MELAIVGLLVTISIALLAVRATRRLTAAQHDHPGCGCGDSDGCSACPQEPTRTPSRRTTTPGEA